MKCAVCGKETSLTVCMSTSSFGSPDLDLRPAPLARNTMSMWYEKCPQCGYVARSISDKLEDPEYIESDEYENLEGMKFSFRTPEMARDFYRVYLVANHCEQPEQAFHALLHAAWACDDAHDRKTAIAFRKKAASMLESFDEEMEPSGEKRKVMHADILRRAKMFSEVIEKFSDEKLEDETLDQILTFEIDRAVLKDAKCYRVSDVIKD